MLHLSCFLCGVLCSIFSFSQEKNTNFSLCSSADLYPYYCPELTYYGTFWEIKRHYRTEYPTAIFQQLKSNSGIVTIQFQVNCKGETGNFFIRQCDLNYESSTIDKEIIGYLLMKTKTLNNWIPAKDKDGNAVNSHKFFSFKIKKGHLIDILPK